MFLCFVRFNLKITTACGVSLDSLACFSFAPNLSSFSLEKTEPCLAEACLRMFHLRFGLSDHLKALLDFVFGSRRRVKKVRIFRA